MNKKEYIAQRLIHDTLTENEQKDLLFSKEVEDEMLHQWDCVPDQTISDKTDGLLIWERIQEQTWLKPLVRKVQFYRICTLAASVALLIGVIGGIYSLANWDNTSKFVVTAGIQNTEYLLLPDGTSVQLGPGSKLAYPEQFGRKSREVELDGQAFFDISKDPKRPFIVKTQSMEVEALGTAFELFSYNIENRSEAILLNGKLKVNLIDPKTDRRTELILLPDDKIEYNIRDKKVTHYSVNADTYTSWRKRGILTFENEKLSMIIPRLEQWYGRKVICEKETAEKYKFTFKVRDESLDRILYMMSESSPIRYEKSEGGDFTLYLMK